MTTETWNSKAGRVLAEHTLRQQRSDTTTSAATTAYVLAVVHLAAGCLLAWMAGHIDDAVHREPRFADLVTYQFDATTLSEGAAGMFLLAGLYVVFAHLTRELQMSGWLGLASLGTLSMLMTMATDTTVVNFTFALNLLMLMLLVQPAARSDCGIGFQTAVRLAARRHTQRLRAPKPAKPRNERVIRLPGDAIVTEPVAEAPHPRAYWDPVVSAWVVWDERLHRFLRYDPLTGAWRTQDPVPGAS